MDGAAQQDWARSRGPIRVTEDDIRRRYSRILEGRASSGDLKEHYNLTDPQVIVRIYKLYQTIPLDALSRFDGDMASDVGSVDRAAIKLIDDEHNEQMSRIRLGIISRGEANRNVLGLQYNLGNRTKRKVHDAYTSMGPEQRETFDDRMRDGSIIAGLREGDNMHTSGMLNNTKRRRAGARAAASASATDILPERPMDEIFRNLSGITRPISYGGPLPTYGGMVRKTRKHKRRTKRKRNAKHTYRKHSKSSKRKSYRHF
jgi:hypothetical protein